jgi:hypothetical protein
LLDNLRIDDGTVDEGDEANWPKLINVINKWIS